jgi:uncharacterized protein YndB with AHSA1/START domain
MRKSSTFTFTPHADRDIVVKRVFDSRREVLWNAFTKPEIIKRWMSGPPAGALTIREMDLRAGGAYRWEWRREALGPVMGLSGVFREVSKPERIVHTEKWDQPWYIGETVVTTAFAEQGGKTALTLTIRYESRAARDGIAKSAIKSGMAIGMAQCYERLEELLASAEADNMAS